jgi:predicted SnoaL-like aldol condensation-catalyzing enzyme
MKIRTMFLALTAVGATFALSAQEVVVGVKDPESLFKGGEGKVKRNKESALHIMKELLQCGQWERSGEWLTDAYHQHNPNAATGRAAVVDFFTKVLKQPRTANCGPLSTPVVAVVAEGDYVTVLMPRTYDDPRTSGKTYSTTWFDTWRFVDGKADEHWDSALINAPPAR